jgi:L-2-hydroxyglutarate oxidase
MCCRGFPLNEFILNRNQSRRNDRVAISAIASPMAIGEWHRSFSSRAFVEALRKLIPELRREDVHRSGAGVRAQALDPAGRLLDDFRIVEAERMVHVLNAPSPAATASISIGEVVAGMAARSFGL